MKPSQQELVPLYTEQHLPSTELARIFESTPATIIRWLRSYGVQIRPTGRMAKIKPAKTPRGTDCYIAGDAGLEFLMRYNFHGTPLPGDEILQDPPLMVQGRIWFKGQLRVLVVPAQ